MKRKVDQDIVKTSKHIKDMERERILSQERVAEKEAEEDNFKRDLN